MSYKLQNNGQLLEIKRVPEFESVRTGWFWIRLKLYTDPDPFKFKTTTRIRIRMDFSDII